MQPLIEKLAELIKFNSTFKTDEIQMSDLIPYNIKNYYNYQGSLTTPNCDEVVEWFVIDKPVIGISEEQLLEFQSIEDENEKPVKKYNFFFSFWPIF